MTLLSISPSIRFNLFITRQSAIRLLSSVAQKDFFGINDITSKDIAGAFSSGTKLAPDKIEKKYNSLLGSRNRLINEEKDKNVPFGRMRFDSENVTLKHGQYEPDQTERLHSTVQVKEMFVPDKATADITSVETPQRTPDEQIDSASIPAYRPPYKISEVSPTTDVGEIFQIFKQENAEKMSALKYKNTPPLTFFFENAKAPSHEEDSSGVGFEPESMLNLSIPTTRSSQRERKQPQNQAIKRTNESQNHAEQDEIRRPQVDLDEQAGPGGAVAPFHELSDLSIEYAERKSELHSEQVQFDRSLEKKLDVQDKEPGKPQKAIDYIKSIRDLKVEPENKGLKHTLETTDRPFALKPVIKLDSHGFRNYSYQVPDWSKVRKVDVLSYLKGCIVFNGYDILAINKPYGISSHSNPSSTREEFDMDSLVGELAKSMRIERVFLAHRLDKTTTGVLLFALSQERAKNLNKLFRANDINKTYICITRGTPDPQQGIIDMPIGDIEVAGKMRMCPAPYDVKESSQLSRKYREARRAITEYRVIDSNNGTALVELKPQSGVKHQLRCHMGFGLKTPILGDHKYSNLEKVVPQRLPPNALKALNLRQTKVRTLPIHLHAKSIMIPGAKANGETLFISAPMPRHFTDNIKSLRLKTSD